jgi:hypothetical protein
MLQTLLSATVFIALATGVLYVIGLQHEYRFLQEFDLPFTLFLLPSEGLIQTGATILLGLIFSLWFYAVFAFGLYVAIFGLARWISRTLPKLTRVARVSRRAIDLLPYVLAAFMLASVCVALFQTASQAAHYRYLSIRSGWAMREIHVSESQVGSSPGCLRASIIRHANGYFALFRDHSQKVVILPDRVVEKIESLPDNDTSSGACQ